jgi:hypothetical protein
MGVVFFVIGAGITYFYEPESALLAGVWMLLGGTVGRLMTLRTARRKRT